MNKGIELTQSQIKSYENGATIFIFPIDTNEMEMSEIGLKKDLLQFAPIQKGDKDIWVKEEFAIYKNPFGSQEIVSYGTWKSNIYIGDKSEVQPTSKMTKEQSRYTISECIDVRVVRVQDILDCYFPKIFKWKKDGNYYTMIDSFISFYNNQLKEQNINRTYEDNDYILLCKVTPLKETK